jgi:hypothetical protein
VVKNLTNRVLNLRRSSFSCVAHTHEAAEPEAVYPPCPNGTAPECSEDILGHGEYTAVELNR